MVLCLSLGTLAGLGRFLLWTTRSIDEITETRERQAIVASVESLRPTVGKDQEGMTTWGEAVDEMGKADNGDWIDENLGSWMHNFFGLDELYVFDPRNRPTFIFGDERRQPLSAYDRRQKVIAPLLERMRGLLVTGAAAPEAGPEQILNVSDYALIDRRPALISVKPIISSTEELASRRDDYDLHVAVRYVDGSYLAQLTKTFDIEDLAFNWARQRERGDASLALRNDAGLVLGYFVWKPFRPGKLFMESTGPVMLPMMGGALAIILILTSALLGRWRRERRHEERLRYLAHHDPLTGLPNRAAFEMAADSLIAESIGRGRSVGILYLDIDRFKTVNDTYGHVVGDRTLVTVARRIRDKLGDGALLSRLGGDEFIAVLPDCPRSEVAEVCDSIVVGMRVPIVLDGVQLKIGITIGASLAPRHGIDRRELTRKADVALYDAKAAGRDRFAIFGDPNAGLGRAGKGRGISLAPMPEALPMKKIAP